MDSGFSVGEAIRLKREQAGMSARALSLRVGMSTAYVYKLEAGLLEPGLLAFARLAKELRMTPAEVWVCIVAGTSRSGANDVGSAAVESR